MGAAYLPPLTTHRALMPFGGIFCYSFPGHATNGARGVRELPVEYQHGEAWILNQYGDSRAAATMVNPFA
jgi:hypothetical protein